MEERCRREQRRQAERFGELQEQVQRLEETVKDLKPQLGRTGALAEDLKRQVELLVEDYSERSPKCCAECEPYPAEAVRARVGLWPQPAVFP